MVGHYLMIFWRESTVFPTGHFTILFGLKLLDPQLLIYFQRQDYR